MSQLVSEILLNLLNQDLANKGAWLSTHTYVTKIKEIKSKELWVVLYTYSWIMKNK